MLKSKIEKVPTTIFDKLYLIFFLFLPLIYVNKLVDPVLVPRQLYLSFFVFLTGLIVCFKIQKKKLVPDFSFLKLPVCIFFVLFLIIIFISFLQSLAISESMLVLSRITMQVLFCLITAYLLIQQQLSLTGLFKSVVVFCIVSVLIALYQLFEISLTSVDFFKDVLEVKSTYGHKNLLASVLFLTFPFLIGTLLLNSKWRIIAIITAFMSLLMCWLIQTKAVILAFFVFFLILFFSFVRQRKFVKKKIFVGVITISTSLLLVVGLITFQNKQKFSRIFDKNSTFERLSLWENSIKMASDHFVFGVGAGNWQVHFPKYGLDQFAGKDIKNGTTTFQRPHNDYLWVLCEMGSIGLVVYILLFLCILYYLIRLWKKNGVQQTYWLYASFFAGMVGYLIIAFVDFPLERIEHQLLIGLLFSIITAHYFTNFKKESISKKSIWNIPTLIYMFAFFASIVFSGIVCYKRCVGEYHSQRIYFYENRNNFGQMIKEADKAMNFFYSMDPMSAPIEWYKGVALFSAGDIPAAQISFERAYCIQPYNMHVINNLASCYEKLKQHTKAEEFYLKALAISSEFEEARLNLSAVYYNQKQYLKAFETIDKCDVSSQDAKYQAFLPAILTSWQEELLKEQKVPLMSKMIPPVKLMETYFESKKKQLNFHKYFLDQLQKN